MAVLSLSLAFYSCEASSPLAGSPGRGAHLVLCGPREGAPLGEDHRQTGSGALLLIHLTHFSSHTAPTGEGQRQADRQEDREPDGQKIIQVMNIP